MYLLSNQQIYTEINLPKISDFIPKCDFFSPIQVKFWFGFKLNLNNSFNKIYLKIRSSSSWTLEKELLEIESFFSLVSLLDLEQKIFFFFDIKIQKWIETSRQNFKEQEANQNLKNISDFEQLNWNNLNVILKKMEQQINSLNEESEKSEVDSLCKYFYQNNFGTIFLRFYEALGIIYP